MPKKAQLPPGAAGVAADPGAAQPPRRALGKWLRRYAGVAAVAVLAWAAKTAWPRARDGSSSRASRAAARAGPRPPPRSRRPRGRGRVGGRPGASRRGRRAGRAALRHLSLQGRDPARAGLVAGLGPVPRAQAPRRVRRALQMCTERLCPGEGRPGARRGSGELRRRPV